MEINRMIKIMITVGTTVNIIVLLLNFIAGNFNFIFFSLIVQAGLLTYYFSSKNIWKK